jgi:hypothetical protein
MQIGIQFPDPETVNTDPGFVDGVLGLAQAGAVVICMETVEEQALIEKMVRCFREYGVQGWQVAFEKYG